jgi:hypothetical protein
LCCLFFFDIRILITSLWYLQTLLVLFSFFFRSLCCLSLKIPKGGNQNPYIGEERTTQWPKEKGQKDKKSLKIPKGGNHNPYIGEEQTTQWPKEKGQKDSVSPVKKNICTKALQYIARLPFSFFSNISSYFLSHLLLVVNWGSFKFVLSSHILYRII